MPPLHATPSPAARRTMQLAALAALPALVLAAAQAAWPWPFVSDDAFISLRYAERLLAGQGLTWTDGERVEGYSNLLWVLGCAALGGLGIDLVAAARALGAACTAIALLLLARALRPHDLRTTLLAAGPPLLVAASAPVLAWTLGGLEGPMVLLWLVWGFVGLFARLDERAGPPLRNWCRAGLPFALLCLTRPDGPLWAATAGLALGLLQLPAGGGASAVRTMLSFGALPAAAVLGQTCFRLAYYGDWVPNTAHVKVDPGAGALAMGLEYVGTGLTVLAGLAACAVFGVLRSLGSPLQRACLVLCLPSLAWLAYLLAVGGDHFPGLRLLHGWLAPAALLAGLGLAHPRGWRGTLAALAAVLVGAAANVLQSRQHEASAHVRHETWEWQGKALGEVLRAAFGSERPRLAVDAAGALPYYSGLPALDMLGLCDRTIATTPVPAWAQRAAAAGGLVRLQGHTRANGAHVMDLAPDLMLFGLPPGLPLVVFGSALEFEDDQRFLDGYRCVVVDTGPRETLPGHFESLQAPLWVRLEGRAGVRRAPDRIEVPAYLLGAYRQPRPLIARHEPAPPGSQEAELRRADTDAAVLWFLQDRFVAAVPAGDGALWLELGRTRDGRPPGVAGLELILPRGRWRVELEPPTHQLVSGIEGLPRDAASQSHTAERDAPATLTLRAGPDATLPVRLQRLVLVRVPD